MFTGIVERTGRITFAKAAPLGRRVGVDAGAMAAECELGASVCVSGVCLTVAAVNGDTIEFDVIRETLDTSTLGKKCARDLVNLERSLRVGDRVDGHFVQGHVDGTGTVTQVRDSGTEHVVRLKPDKALMPYIIPKGSVTIDGVSLTIAEVDRDGFAVALIPTTLERTTFSRLSAGDLVNIETDIVARTIVHRLAGLAGGHALTVETLRGAGFA
ncbi:MAG: riboflavin synthase [Planctomycetes bacterium]|nr:riboflavin synthase [Planctomycetota bacterium]